MEASTWRRVAAVAAASLIAAACSGGDGDAARTTAASTTATTAASASTTATAMEPPRSFEAFAAHLDELRELLRIPGMSVAVVEGGAIVFAEGFGYADVEAAEAATADTSYHLASVTKPIAATMIMQLVEEGVIDLDDPVADYGVEVEAAGDVTVWHLLTHTSRGVPGASHQYDGNRYAQLDTVVEEATGTPFRTLMFQRILERADMTRSAGNSPGCNESEAAIASEPWGHEVRAAMAAPYQLDQAHNVARSTYPGTYSPAAGLIASVSDVARFDIALDAGALLGDEAIAAMWQPLVATVPGSETMAYGLGWYVQDHEGLRILWHAGRWPPAVSALYLKVPELGLSFIAAANTPNLSTPFPLGRGDALSSALALAFYREFVFPARYDAEPPTVDWDSDDATLSAAIEEISDPPARWLLERELWARRQVLYSVGSIAESERLLSVLAPIQVETTGLDGYLASAADVPVLEGAVALSPAEMDRYVGLYLLDRDASTWLPEFGDPPDDVWMYVEGDRLISCAGDSGSEAIVPLGDHRFRVASRSGSPFLLRAVVEGGTVVRLEAEVTPEVTLVFVPEG